MLSVSNLSVHLETLLSAAPRTLTFKIKMWTRRRLKKKKKERGGQGFPAIIEFLNRKPPE